MSMNRRQFATALAAMTLPLQASALSADASRQMVEALVVDVNEVIAANLSEAEMITRFAQILAKFADVPTIARYCLGPDARSASEAQMRVYTPAFANYIAAKYGRRFREFVGGEVTVIGAKPIKSWIEVETAVQLKGRGRLQMDWHVSDRSGRLAFFNFIIEGVNMLLTERTEVGAMLDREKRDLDKLTEKMAAA